MDVVLPGDIPWIVLKGIGEEMFDSTCGLEEGERSAVVRGVAVGEREEGDASVEREHRAVEGACDHKFRVEEQVQELVGGGVQENVETAFEEVLLLAAEVDGLAVELPLQVGDERVHLGVMVQHGGKHIHENVRFAKFANGLLCEGAPFLCGQQQCRVAATDRIGEAEFAQQDHPTLLANGERVVVRQKATILLHELGRQLSSGET